MIIVTNANGERFPLRNPEFVSGGETVYLQSAPGRYRATTVISGHGLHARVKVPGTDYSDLYPLHAIWIRPSESAR